MTLELLSNVKRTEDSLMKLKRSRRSLIPEASSGMSDDNKIRLQLAIDIEAYITQVRYPLSLSLSLYVNNASQYCVREWDHSMSIANNVTSLCHIMLYQIHHHHCHLRERSSSCLAIVPLVQ